MEQPVSFQTPRHRTLPCGRGTHSIYFVWSFPETVFLLKSCVVYGLTWCGLCECLWFTFICMQHMKLFLGRFSCIYSADPDVTVSERLACLRLVTSYVRCIRILHHSNHFRRWYETHSR